MDKKRIELEEMRALLASIKAANLSVMLLSMEGICLRNTTISALELKEEAACAPFPTKVVGYQEVDRTVSAIDTSKFCR